MGNTPSVDFYSTNIDRLLMKRKHRSAALLAPHALSTGLIGNCALAEGVEQNPDVVDSDAIERAIVKARKDFRDQFNSQERLLIDGITNQGVLSDSNISLTELQQLGAKSFAELLPVLEELQRRDLIERLPNDGSISYKLSPLMLPAEPSQPIDPPT